MNTQSASGRKIIFVGGLHRSGTTMLQLALREHPMISGFRDTGVPENEGQFLQSVYFPRSQPGAFGFDQSAHMTEDNVLVTGENRQKVFSSWSRYWDMSRPFLMEKSPPNLIRMRFLQAMFPNAYFIIMIRHPVPSAFLTREWTGAGAGALTRILKRRRKCTPGFAVRLLFRRTLWSLMDHWATCHDMFLADRKNIKRLYVLKYEDVVKNPDKCLREIYGFLDVKYHRERFHGENYERIRTDVNERCFSMWNALTVKKGVAGAYSRSLQERFEPAANRVGYSLYCSGGAS